MAPTTQSTSPTVHRDLLQATDRALAAAHDAHLREATREVRWERRGLLRRLVRRRG
jgi:hypothetical protein